MVKRSEESEGLGRYALWTLYVVRILVLLVHTPNIVALVTADARENAVTFRGFGVRNVDDFHLLVIDVFVVILGIKFGSVGARNGR